MDKKVYKKMKNKLLDCANDLEKYAHLLPKEAKILDFVDEIMVLVEEAEKSGEVTAKQWSKDVETHWEAPEGFFTQSAEKIAQGLKSASKSLQQAMSRLNFYINRAGANLSAEDKKRLELAKEKLHKLYPAAEAVASKVEILWSKELSNYADDDEIEMQDALLERKARQYGGEGAILFPEECSVDRNYLVVYKPEDADIEDVAKALMGKS